MLYPVVWLVNGLANLVLKPFKVHTNVELMEHLNREELRTLVKEGGKQIPDDHQRMLVNILDLEQATIEDVMIPRQDIVGIDLDDDWDEILLQLTQTVYTRNLAVRDELTLETLESLIREPYFIPEGTALTQQLLEFQRRERRMGLVVDEYGDIQGLVTLDDILEEIVGEYTAESRARSREIRLLDDGSYLVDGGVSLRTLNRTLDWALDEDEASTLNGLLLEELGEIPTGKASLKIGPHIMTILEIKENVVGKVLIKPNWIPE